MSTAFVKYSSPMQSVNFNRRTDEFPESEEEHQVYRSHDLSTSGKDDDKEYDPFQHRSVERPTSDIGVFAHLLKGSMGTGLLAMPEAFKHAGLTIGIGGTIVVGILCLHCIQILVQSSHTLCRRTRVPSLSYTETAEVAFLSGPKVIRSYASEARVIINTVLMVTYYSTTCVYVVFIATSFKQVVDVYYENNFSIRVYILFLLVPLVALGLIRDLKTLVPFSIVADILLVITFSITLYYILRHISMGNDIKYYNSIEQLPLFISTSVFAMEGIGVVMPLENNMKHPSHFLGCPGILYPAMIVIITLYAVLGFFGYLDFGESTAASITLNLPMNEVPAQIVQVLIGLAIFFTYGLQFYIPSEVAWKVIQPKIQKNPVVVERILRVSTVIGTVAVALAVPNLGPIISLVGSVCFSTVGFLCPSVIETVTLWEDGLGPGRWRLWKNIFIFIFGLIAFFSGAVTSIQQIIINYQ